MKIVVDTNVLIRSVMLDDQQQAQVAIAALNKADAVVVPLAALCEFVWVLRKVYGLSLDDIAAAIRVLVAVDKILVNRPAVDLGLAMLKGGGDFADGAIAHEGAELGGDTFVSFDKKAANTLAELGISTNLLC